MGSISRLKKIEQRIAAGTGVAGPTFIFVGENEDPQKIISDYEQQHPDREGDCLYVMNLGHHVRA